jgi:hypothetical protein
MTTIRSASFDIGRCNFAQYIEDFCSDDIIKIEKEYNKLPKSLQRKMKGPMNSEIEKLLLATVMCGSRVQTGVYNFTSDVQDEGGWDITARMNFLKHLSDFQYIWDTCDVFVIEQQYFNTTSFGNKKKNANAAGANVDAIKIAEATFLWLLERYPFKTITYFGSQYKTQIFGAPWKLNKAQRKQWSVDQANHYYSLRQDIDMINLYELSEAVKRKQIKTEKRVLEFKNNYPCTTEDGDQLSTKIIREKQKLDDTSDAFMQLQAFKFKTMVGCF